MPCTVFRERQAYRPDVCAFPTQSYVKGKLNLNSNRHIIDDGLQCEDAAPVIPVIISFTGHAVVVPTSRLTPTAPCVSTCALVFARRVAPVCGLRNGPDNIKH